MVAAAWLLTVVLVGAAAFACADATPVARMLAIVSALFLGMKAVVLAAARAEGRPPLRRSRLLLFAVWFGMNPAPFTRDRARARAPERGPDRGPDRGTVRALLWRGLRNVAAGAVLVCVARAIGATWAAPLLMVGLSLGVHFGLLTWLATGLRARGLPVPVLFDAPFRARTLAEFWARRWNRGFAEMTALCIQRPLQRRFGRATALLGAFLASGLLHELAISLPVRAGYGGPSCYFALHGVLTVWRGDRPGRAFVLAAVVLPLPLVFHPWFVRGVVVPLLG